MPSPEFLRLAPVRHMLVAGHRVYISSPRSSSSVRMLTAWMRQVISAKLLLSPPLLQHLHTLPPHPPHRRLPHLSTIRSELRVTRWHMLSSQRLPLPRHSQPLRHLRLQPLRETADYVIDTTGLNSRDIMKALSRALSGLSDKEPPIRAEVMSFGFKRGLPRQADLVIDVRFLPNPFYIEGMSHHTGLDEDVRSFVMEHPVTKEFMKKWTDLLSFLIPCYREEGKHRLVIAVGCTGGVHRSVTITEAIGAFLREMGLPTEITHRDLMLEQARWNTPVEDGE